MNTEPRVCKYSGGTCARRGCAIGCHASALTAEVESLRNGFSAALVTVCRTLIDEGEKPADAWLQWIFEWSKTMDREVIIESHIDAAVAALKSGGRAGG